MARWRTLALAAATAIAGCGPEQSSPSSTNEAIARAATRQQAGLQTKPTTCAVGAQPNYFVPGPSNGSPMLLGCARPGVSGKRVEFSANLAHIGRRQHACVNPAYAERGRGGVYIPAICKLSPALTRFAIRDATRPQQGVSQYAFVIWEPPAPRQRSPLASLTGRRARP